MNEPFKTNAMSGEKIISLAQKTNGGGVNESIPMTRRVFPTLSKKQRIRDSEIVQELVYLHDVLNDKDRAVEVFFENKHRMSDPCFWEILRTMWIANGKRENLLAFRRLFESKRPFKKFLMTVEEEAVFNELPDTVTAYRAPGSTVGDPGISWTLDKEFADRYAKSMNRAVIEREMPKSRIVAYFSRRGEQEVIIL